MDASWLRHSEFPHTSRLFTDFLYRFDRVAGFYDHPPGNWPSFAAAAGLVSFPPERRAALVSTLRQQNGGSPALDLLARPETMVVATGQQVGLFSGPVYTIYKALTAAKLARELTGRGIPAVPVFWLATEDHDFAEVRECWTFDASHCPVRLEIEGRPEESGPVGRIEIAAVPSAELRRSLRNFAFGPEVAALAERTYVPGRTLGEAFGDLLKELLSAYGLLFVDPMRPAVRELAAPLLRRAVEAGQDLTRLVLERNSELEAADYHAQVRVEPAGSLLFLLDNGRRMPLRRDGEHYIADSGRFGASELAGRAGQLSPNALLRPVMQDYILPTVAYVGGPAELAYLAQSQVLYRALLGRMPVAVHRGSFTLIDARCAKLFGRYGVSLPDFFHGEAALREHIARKLVPAALAGSLEEASRRTEAEIGRLRSDLMSFDPTLAAAVDNSKRKVLHQLARLERKVAREVLRRNERASRDTSYLYQLVWPGKRPQERVYSILPFLAKHGFDLIGRIYENVRLDCPDHRILVV